MIFYKNTKRGPKQKQVESTFSAFEEGLSAGKDDSIEKFDSCKLCYNVSFEDGTLSTGLGMREFQVPVNAENLETLHTFDMSEVGAIRNLHVDKWYNGVTLQYYYQVFIVDQNNKIRVLPALDPYNGLAWVQSTRLSVTPTYSCAYRNNDVDISLFFSSMGALCINYGQEHLYENVPEMISCVIHYGNFFGITKSNRNKLIYTTKTNLALWTEDEGFSVIEFLDNRGAFTKLITFNDYVYLFRENGITKISKYSLNGEFSFTHLYYSPSRIYEQSVCVCGSKIFFATRDGLYTFDGNRVEKILEKYDAYFKNLDNKNCSSTCVDGRYYLATKCNFNDGETVGCESASHINNALFEVDIYKQSVEVLRGVDIKQIASLDCPYYSKVIFSFNTGRIDTLGELTHDGMMFGEPTQKSWSTFETDFGFHNKRKKISEIILTAKFDCQVVIESDEETKIFNFFGDEKTQRMRICVCGKMFKVKFLSQSADMKICKPKFVFDVVL